MTIRYNAFWIISAVLAILIIPLLGTTTLQAAPPTPFAVDHPPYAPIDPDVIKELSAKGQTTFIVHLKARADLRPARQAATRTERLRTAVSLLQATAERSQAPLRALLEKQRQEGHVSRVRPYWIFNGIAVTGDMTALTAIAARPEVARIRANRTIRLDPPIASASARPEAIMWGIQRIGADRVWQELGITGRGVVVASLDTGVDWTHPALRHQYRGAADGIDHNYNWFDVTGTYPIAPGDDNGHGTHTMGIMVGDDGAGNQIGVAPGARWIAVKVFDDRGTASVADLHAGFQWILAPTDLNGQNPDPTRAPDILNNSWGARNGAYTEFWDDIAALRAAGIFVVFSAGNRGEDGPGSVGSPGSYPHSFNVGATDPNDLLTSFSSLGPSFWGEIRPNITAPGAYIRSSTPGGLYDTYSGTSMAAPHAAGAAALLLEADPTLSPEDIATFLEETAVDLGEPGRDNAYGAGRLDAYRATQWAITAGKLSGTVYHMDGTPLPNATVTGIRQDDPAETFRTTTDAQGRYQVAVPAGVYTVTAEAYGYEPQTFSDVTVIRGYQSLRDFRLPKLPYGALVGLVHEADGPPLTDFTVIAVPVGRAEPVFTTGPIPSASGQAQTNYQLFLPPGDYEVRAESWNHRIVRSRITVPAKSAVRLDFALPSAPSILLLENDVWVGDDSTLYYRRALDLADYLYDVERIAVTTTVPTSATLGAYDVIVWAAPWSSPGYIDRTRGDTELTSALRDYLDQGGRILISGQDIGYWDGGGDPNAPEPLAYYREYLHANFLRDNAGASLVIGAPADILAGIQAELNHPTAYKRQNAPDEIRPADAAATPIWLYDSPNDIAGLRAESGAYRTIYWAFGLEGAGPPEAMAQALDASITWLTRPQLDKTVSLTQASPGTTLAYTLTVRNVTSSPLTGLHIRDPLPPGLNIRPETLSATAGQATYDAASREVRWTGSLDDRSEAIITFQAELASDLEGGVAIRNEATLETASGLRLTRAVTTTVLAPDLSGSIKQVSRAMALPGDTLVYTITLRNAGQVPAEGTTVVDPLPAGVTYVTGTVTGGATFNQALQRVEWTGTVSETMPGHPDYTWIDSDGRGPGEDAPTFAWVDITADGTALSLRDDSVSDPIPLPFPFPFYDRRYTQIWISSNGWLSFRAPSSSRPSNSGLPSANAPEAMIAPFWDDLNPSSGGQILYRAEPDRFILSFIEVPRFSTGGPYTFQTILYPDGTILVQYQSMQGTRLDEATIGLQDESRTRGVTVVQDAPYVHDELALRFDPPQPPIPGEHAISFQVRLADDLPGNSVIENRATIDAPQGLRYQVTATTRVAAPDLSQSLKRVSAPVALPGDILTYTLTIRNTGLGVAQAALADPLPSTLTYVAGSVQGDATYDADERAIKWTGTVAPGQTITVSFAAQITTTIQPGERVTNTAFLRDGTGAILPLQATTEIQQVNLSRSSKVAYPSVAASGDLITYTITLINSGQITATQASLYDPLPAGLTYVPGSASGDATYNAEARRIEWQGTIAAYGESYSWRTSRDPNGPTFAWVDITDIGTRITGLADDRNVGPFPVGFKFPFFGKTFTEFRLSSNGFITFGGTASDFSNERLPSPNAPPNLIAAWWDDLNISLGGQVYYWSNGVDTLVVSFEEVMRFGGGGPYTFQMILHADGSILFQYLSMSPPLGSATIGIQNEDGTEGLTISHEDSNFMQDELAIEIAPPSGRHTIRFVAQVDEGLPPETVITNTAVIRDGLGHEYERSAAVRVNTVDLSRSRLDVAPPAVMPGDLLTYTVTIRNQGNAPASNVTASVALPPESTYEVGSATHGATYDASTRQVRWFTPALPAGAEEQFTFQARAHAPLADGTVLRAQGTVSAEGTTPSALEATAAVEAPDLAPSDKHVSSEAITVHDVLTYTITLQNAGHATAIASFVDPLPATLTYLEGSAWAGSGPTPTYEAASRTIRWEGRVPSKSLVTIQFRARAVVVGSIENVATVSDQYGVTHELRAVIQVHPRRIWVPSVHKAAP